ncbi:MAG: ABC transporter permease [Bacteroidota bacterium]
MFVHLFKLIWNKKKQNSLLIVEMFISFLVMFAVLTMLVYSYKNFRQPVGFDYNDVWVISFSPPEKLNDAISVSLFQDALKKTLFSMPQIKAVSFSGSNVPFSMNTSNSRINYGKTKSVMTNFYDAEESFPAVMNMQMVEGRWYNKADDAAKYRPVVINRKLKEELFGNENAVGKLIGEENYEQGKAENRFKVMGVVENAKDKGSYQAIENGIYVKMDSNALRWAGTMVIKVKPGTDASFESKLFKTVSNAVGTSVEIEHLDKKLVSKNKVLLVPMIIAAVVAGFLIINVALGLFGVLWYNINKRKGEIGLRRAVGATGNNVSAQLVGEALVLATIALIIGLFFAVQFPLMNVFDLPANTYLTAIGLAVIFIYILVIICALYPGKQAAGIYPAVALHEE